MAGLLFFFFICESHFIYHFLAHFVTRADRYCSRVMSASVSAWASEWIKSGDTGSLPWSGAASPAQVAASSVGSALAIVLFLSQAPSMRAMLLGGPAPSRLPTALQLTNCLLWVASAALVQGSLPLLLVNAAGAVICTVYAGCFVIAAPAGERLRAAALFGGIVTAVAAVVLFVLACDGFVLPLGPVTSRALAGCAVAANTAMFGGPLLACAAAVRTLRADRLPTLLLAASLACAASWTAYGVLTDDLFVTLPNAIGCALSAGQLGALAYIRMRVKAQREESVAATRRRRRGSARQRLPGSGTADLEHAAGAAPDGIALTIAAAVAGAKLTAPPLPANTTAGSLPAAASTTSLDGLLTPAGSAVDLRALAEHAGGAADASSTATAGGDVTPPLRAGDETPPHYSSSPTHEIGNGFSMDEEEAVSHLPDMRRRSYSTEGAIAAQKDATAVAAALRRMLTASTTTGPATAASYEQIAALAARLAQKARTDAR